MALRLLLALLMGLSAAGVGRLGAAELRPTARVTSQTTTTLVTAVSGQTIGVTGGSICIDANGVTTGLKLQDSAGTNIVGTGIVYVLSPGQCWVFPRTSNPYFTIIGGGLGLQLVTSVGNGPVEVALEVVQQ